MRKISVFDVIGPIMIGPSSSHTAGALRISQVAYKIFKDEIKEANFTLYGSFSQTYKGHGTDRALIGGILGFNTENEKIKNSFELAKEKGISISFEIGEMDPDMHPNTVEIDLKGEQKTLSIMGESIGGGAIIIKKINGIDVKFTGEYTTVIVQQIDKPGVAAHITKVLTEQGINIAFMSIFRESMGEKAFTVLELDEKMKPDLLDELKNSPNINDVFLVEM
ncbi:L-serine dehydratase [Acetoanaerobium pronyense]|uniref:L-serine deaminase n=1 Tax=Acetoanaerobium pronyense TaxID=1482736 RepID=A0ABS4KIK9_9FIRM|nr:L-serine ammonia-lyase, iron-sulfur-dependent subunit beta [Acetoanaerobium pronyense]MBP2026971.1 L-serine dehydratase [Acetoanaerobium pronyense]